MLLGSTLALQGCAAVLIGSAGVATKSATDARTVGTQVDDGTLELRVANALATNKELKSTAHINETAYQGKVLLTGQAPSQALADKAREIAAKTEGTTE
ncbi:BON domain-containing protein, partial [Rosenbergiella nectarea]|uniref:BON domain-containing protein n=1 Tax=Rosenbergiella nectarea TaxID=988801 RepID=UPI001F4F8E72